MPSGHSSQNGQSFFRRTYSYSPNNLSRQGEPKNKVPWEIGMVTPAKMIISFILGVAFAAGHHFYYSRLEGVGKLPQSLAVNGLPTLFIIAKSGNCGSGCRAVLIAAVSIVYDQYVWTRARKYFITISGLDAMFSAVRSPWSFFNWHYLWHAQTGVLMAAVAWLIPFSMLLTSAALTVLREGNLDIANMADFGNSTLDQLGLVRRMNSSITTNQTVRVDTDTLVYAYNRSTLLNTYGVVIGLTLVCVIVGLAALHSKGVSHNTSLSSVLATTRNPMLDKLMEGNSLGGLPLPREIEKTKLKLSLREIQGTPRPRMGFRLMRGTEIQRGVDCY